MIPCALGAILLSIGMAWAGAIGPDDPHSRAATGFPGAYLQTVRLSLTDEPAYGSRFLDALTLHVRSIAALKTPVAVSVYLEEAITRGVRLKQLRENLGRETLSPPQAAALLAANAIYRPDLIHQVIDGLEAVQSGLGRRSAALFHSAKGNGDKTTIKALRSAGARRPRLAVSNAGQNWAELFDLGVRPQHEDRTKRDARDADHQSPRLTLPPRP